jgi:hypothetical protein
MRDYEAYPDRERDKQDGCGDKPPEKASPPRGARFPVVLAARSSGGRHDGFRIGTSMVSL